MSRNKIIIGIVGLVVLLIGVVAGVLLIRRVQDIRKKAAPSVTAGSLSLVRSDQEIINAGDTFDVQIRVGSAGEEVIATDVVINYPSSLLEVVDSIALVQGTQILTTQLFSDYQYANATGVDPTSGVIDVGGYNISSGVVLDYSLFATITFRALQADSGDINFDFVPGQTDESNVVYYQPGEPTDQAIDLLTSATGINITVQAVSATPTPTPTPTIGAGDTQTPTNTPTPTPTESQGTTAASTPTSTPTPTPSTYMPDTAGGITELPDSGIGTPLLVIAGLGLLLLLFAGFLFAI